MKISIIFCVIKMLINAIIDKNGIQIFLPNDWDGRWTLNDTVFKFKPDYIFSIGEGMIQKISESEYKKTEDQIKDISVNLRVNDYKVEKAISTVDINLFYI